MTREEFEALPAVYYDACESEYLSHECVEDAMEDYLDRNATVGGDLRDDIRALAPIEVVAFARMEPGDGWIEAVASDLLERALEQWGEEFGDPDGGGGQKRALANGLPAMVVALRDFFGRLTSWACEPIGRYLYSAEECEVLLHEDRPNGCEPTTQLGKATP